MDTVFFIMSKLAGAFLRIDTWIVMSLIVTVWALLRQRYSLALGISGTMLIALLTLSIFPLGSLLLRPIEERYPANPSLSEVDGIIVLGGGEDLRASSYWGHIQLNEGGDRFVAGLLLARRFPNARLLFTGGSGALRDFAGTEVSEATFAKRFFLDQGISPNRLEFEGRSRNTAENARLSLALLEPQEEQTWVLVTSAFHMPRAMRSFEAAGWSGLVAWPTDYRTAQFADQIGWNFTRNAQILNTAIRELIGEIAYRMSGR